MKKRYFDNQSSSKLDNIVLDEMLPFFCNNYGVPQSIHSFGIVVKKAVEKARYNVAKLFNAYPDEIIFTSCGTEANNLAIKGIVELSRNPIKHIIVSSIEHISILQTLKLLIQQGVQVTFLPVNKYGSIDRTALKNSILDNTILISIQYANPEIGTIQNIKELVSIVREQSNNNIIFHTDAVSACGKVKINVKDLDVDMLTVSSSVIHGPKGAAALYIRRGVKLSQQIHGGIQEFGQRAGTENVPAIVGFGKACEIARTEFKINNAKIIALRDKMLVGITKKIDYISLNGPVIKNRLCSNINLSVKFVEGESLVLLLDALGIIVSSGSACSSYNLKGSHVLKAIKVDRMLQQGTIIFNLSKFNTMADIRSVLIELPKCVSKLRKISSLHLNVSKGIDNNINN
ncbi:MAG: aminotransferase class V-fold PLP-dependent enzyme [Endomicrobium sp.]|jgi:cysteine desulfurase|nr:aminotransferase class V-fold PLP-dependent enzyme [Endomicrobium sp.]